MEGYFMGYCMDVLTSATATTKQFFSVENICNQYLLHNYLLAEATKTFSYCRKFPNLQYGITYFY